MRVRLPKPLVPAHVDVRDLDGFMLNAERLMTSELFALSTGAEFKAAVALWCRAWKQFPGGSLPDDDKILAAFSGAGEGWSTVKNMALRGFIKCSDGRLYHRTLSDDVLKAYAKKEIYLENKNGNLDRKKKERDERANMFKQLKLNGITPSWNTSTSDLRELVTALVTPPVTVTVTANTGQGQGQGQSKKKEERTSVTPAAGATAEHTPTKMGPADFDPWLKAVRKSIPRGWTEDLARRRWTALPAHPVEVWITAWETYIDDTASKSADSKFPQRVRFPENWFQGRAYQDWLDIAIEADEKRRHRLTERQATIALWGEHATPTIAAITEDKFDAWFLGSTIKITAPARATIAIPREFQARWLIDHPALLQAISKALGLEITIQGPERRRA